MVVGEVSSTIVAQLLDGAGRFGIPSERIVAELPHSMSELRRRLNRVSWDTLVDAHELLEREGLGPADFEALGASIQQLPSAGFMARLASSVVDARQMLIAGARWLGPSLFPVVRSESRELSDGRIELTFEIPAERRGCEAFFHVNKGVIEAGPALLGLPRAVADAEISSHRAVFRVRPPVERSVLRRTLARARAMVASGALFEELGKQQDEISGGLDALARARSGFRQVIERLPVAVCVLRRNQPVYVNPAFTQSLGYDLAAVRDRDGVLSLVHPEDRAAAARHLLAEGKAGELMAIEFRFIGADDREVLLEPAPMQELHFEDEPAELFVARDVTDRRRLEQELERADRLSALGRLVASVGHELNNPLAYVGLHLRRLGDLLDSGKASVDGGRAEADASLRAAAGGIERARSVVADLMNFTRGTEQEAELIDPREVVNASAALVGKQIEQRARIAKDYQLVDPVRANRGRLEQVVVNLMLNAAQSFGERPRSENEIRLRVAPDGERVVIEVADNGVGIAPEVQARLFQPFFTTRPSGGGTGLGLAICQEIVTRLGGEISVSSEPGSGARFRVSLPAQAVGTLPKPVTPSTAPSPPVDRARVLIVDDEPNLSEVLRTLIELHGHHVTNVGRGDDALELLTDNGEFDFILCDLMMCGLSGMELHAQLCEVRPGMERRMTFMTGGAYTDEARAFIERIPNACLQKPFDLDRVLEMIQHATLGGPAAG